ncbi:MAG: type IIA DNA topoisomerase subunit B [Waddliaceae bacterium]|jgi:topoisomerase IV subunit B|nr:type IIA DNA topoisomerase subunit B [Waddliaceae bacterium]MBT3579090.1 type IIA DNA topoisomerase subunit B [Waddliaceae bacterium]MBT4444820.1 type IIA DNA topoisomerase subunit B [Waddliaceae bacterium]MBT6928495.1 type IIA DNA topoisomerase subunit B [Waddliaceae bacterium]MBT7264352.1 type IIA DNA topoisomerase subunit B [Waddliaceae bacterium]
MAKKYDESTVVSLDALQHIRIRSGMYIGRLGDGSNPDDGIYVLLKEVIDNSVDEFIMGHGDVVDITIDKESCSVSIRDYGRGIPLGKVIDCVSKINTGAKYNDDVFQFSVGLNGVGTKAVNALSSYFMVRSHRDGKYTEASFEQGIIKKKKKGSTKEPNGTYVEFVPDPAIFDSYEFQDEYVMKRLWNYAYLNTGLTLDYNGEKISSDGGLLDLLNAEVSEDSLYEPLHYKGKGLEFAFLHAHSYGETYFSFVNGQYTADGGTHLSAFREGILKGLNAYADKNFQGVDVREGIVGAVLVKVKDPVFESQTKNKLGNTDIRASIVQHVKDAVIDLLYKNAETSSKIIERIAFNEKLRRELSSVKKIAKEKQKKISYKIPKLRDCKFHFSDNTPDGENSMIFLTEGDSASASILSSRNPLTQAVFSLRGKPLNVFGLKRDQLYKNEEMFNLMNALNIEDDIENLRYNKIILATDADVDGMHIRNLLLTFFMVYFEGIALNGHLSLLETPLFKVRNKKETIYCYSAKERDSALRKLKGSNIEVTRFKGLGEISPNEFKQFIGDNMRLKTVTVNAFSDIKPSLEFYMGKNTPKRKQFIIDNLISEEKELHALAKITSTTKK